MVSSKLDLQSLFSVELSSVIHRIKFYYEQNLRSEESFHLIIPTSLYISFTSALLMSLLNSEPRPMAFADAILQHSHLFIIIFSDFYVIVEKCGKVTVMITREASYLAWEIKIIDSYIVTNSGIKKTNPLRIRSMLMR